MMPVRDADGRVVGPEMVLAAYAQGCFPMAEHRSGTLDWYRPRERAIITWDAFRVPRSLGKTMAKRPYRITHNRACAQVIAACAARSQTWISHDIEALYVQMHELGFVHSVEAWDQQGNLVGGLYGLTLGRIFCGESLFHRANDAAKCCVVRLVASLRESGFISLDCQQQSPHMERFGAYQIRDSAYQGLLASALEDWPALQWVDGDDAVAAGEQSDA